MFKNRKNLDRYLSYQFDLLNELLEDLNDYKADLKDTMDHIEKHGPDSVLFLRFLKQDVEEAQRLVDKKRNHIKKVIDDHRVPFPDLLGESMKSNRHVSHLGGLGSGDGLSTSLNQDMNPPKISGGGFEGTADANFSKKIGQLRVHIDDNGDLMFPENENIETVRKKDTIRGKVPFDGRYKMRESKKSKKTLIDLFNDKFFETEEDATHFKRYNTKKDLPEEFCEKIMHDEIKDNLNYNREFNNPTQKASKLSVKGLTKKIKNEVFNQIERDAKEKGMKLVLKENVGCSSCGKMYKGSACCEDQSLIEGVRCEGSCGMMEGNCMCEEQMVDELNALAAGNIGSYMTKLSTPKSMKKHKEKMLPTGYKYRQ